MDRPIRILGIDPGLRRTGWGVIDVDGNRLIHVACGSVITNDKADVATRLVTIHDSLVRVIEEFHPDEAAVEATFVNKDASATLKLGSGARHRAVCAGARGPRRFRIRAQSRKEDHRRHRPRREARSA
jgi:crossover junction endodeoxyribonuclease RuvC